MSYTREGFCIQCGECCKEIGVGTGLIDEETGLCKYISQDGELYICLITAGKFDVPTEKEPEIPQEDYDYWLKECKPYPDPKNEVHLPPIYDLHKKCSFRMVENIG